MKMDVIVGDVLACPADVLISTANPWLNLSGGVNGAILSSCGSVIQEELHGYLKQKGVSAVPAGTVVQSQPGSLPFKKILHAVAIDPFYDSSIDLARAVVTSALEMAVDMGCTSISSPTLATGYGPLSIDDFGRAVAPLVKNPTFSNLALAIVVRSKADADILWTAITDTEA